MRSALLIGALVAVLLVAIWFARAEGFRARRFRRRPFAGPVWVGSRYEPSCTWCAALGYPLPECYFCH